MVFLLMIIELFWLGVTAKALQANINSTSAFFGEMGKFGPKFQVQGGRHSSSRKHTSFRLVTKIGITSDDLERRNSPNRRVISPNSVAFGADNVKVVEDTPVLSAAEM